MTVLRSPPRSVLRSSLYSQTYGKWGNSALDALRGAQGFAIVAKDDAVAVVDRATPANNFLGTMAEALARGIMVYSSPSTKYVIPMEFTNLLAGITDFAERTFGDGKGTPPDQA